MPAVFGMNFQSVTTAQTKAPHGYTSAFGAMSPGLAGAFEHIDGSIRQMLAELAKTGDARTTTVILTAKHGRAR